MVPWIQVYSNILTHDKTYALAERLKIPNYAAVGIMVSLWAWASINATDGDITNYPPRAIAEATGWKGKKAEDFYEVLLDIWLIEKRDNHVFIRNWERYASMLMDMMENQRKKTNERVKRHREKVRNAKRNGDSNIPCNVTDTLSNGSTVPNLTRPYDDDGDDACAEEITPSGLFARYFGKTPTPAEEEQCVIWLQGWEPELVGHAFFRACSMEQKNLAYVSGVLQEFRRRGINSMGDVAEDDMRHAAGR